MKSLGQGEWVFRSRSGTPVDPKNAANRYLRPVAKELGLTLGGWHDFRHTLSTQLLRRYPTKVVSELLGHSNEDSLHRDIRMTSGGQPNDC
ncbi:MAG: tyrosine-type recombinase/integrase [Candidatus Acidiferrales bacterium]